jgi:D-sedoheptulose 7-phosphate isomerase
MTTAQYQQDLARTINAIDTTVVDRIVDHLYAAWRERTAVVICGDGGSAATASHIVADLRKNLFVETGCALNVTCPSDNVPLLTAWANDVSFPEGYAMDLRAYVQPPSVVVLVSTSGNSPNLVLSATEAVRLGCTVIALIGQHPRCHLLARGLNHLALIIPSTNTQIVEDCHMAVLHMVYRGVLERARIDQ